MRLWMGDALAQSYEEGLDEADILIPSPSSRQLTSSILAGVGTMGMGHFNLLGAEACLQLGRHDDALAHAERFEKECWGPQVPCWAPWLKGRIIGRKAQSDGAPENKEVLTQLQRSHAAAKTWGSPLIAALALQEIVALCPKQAAATDIASQLEEERFELTMDTASPMRTHIESGETFAPGGL